MTENKRKRPSKGKDKISNDKFKEKDDRYIRLNHDGYALFIWLEATEQYYYRVIFTDGYERGGHTGSSLKVAIKDARKAYRYWRYLKTTRLKALLKIELDWMIDEIK